MNVLIYVGYQAIPFNPSTLETVGLGGTEIACIKLSKELKRFGHNVIVSGGVLPGTFNGIEWLPTNECHEKYFDKFNIIIAASYIHATLEFKNYLRDKFIFWAHNTDFHSWWRGNEIKEPIRLLNGEHVDRVVCLTEWHKNQWHSTWGTKDIEVIGNGIDTSTFIGRPPKVKNSFIWSSAPERGLLELLKNWKYILHTKPDATLNIFSPSYSIDQLDNSSEIKELLNQTGIAVRGNVSQVELHTAMLKSEYWMYITDYEETYCITALEMQYARVLPIVTNIAALKETVYSGIKLDLDETNWPESIQLLNILGNELKSKSIESAYQWAKMQTWSNRGHKWNELLNELCT